MIQLPNLDCKFIRGFSHTSLTSHAPGGRAGVKMWDLEILPDFDFVAARGIHVSQTHVQFSIVIGPCVRLFMYVAACIE